MKFSKKLIVVIMTIIFTLAMISCGGKSPTKFMEGTLDNIKSGNVEGLSYILNVNKNISDSSDEYEESLNAYKECLKKINYKVNSEEKNGDNAKVNVTVNGPDMSEIMTKFMKNAFSEALSQAFSGNTLTKEESNKKYDKMLSELLGEVEYTERTMDINLVKENNEWAVKDENEVVMLILNIDPSKMEDIMKSQGLTAK